MIEILLDTNIFRADPSRGKAGFGALVRLAKSGKLRLHVPYFVQREFVSQEIENYEKNINAISQALINLQRKPIPPHLIKKLEELRKRFSGIKNDLISNPENEFLNWVKDVNGVLHSVSEKHGNQIAKDYFDGAPPFRSKKNRDDIPDAFIWQVILDLAHEYSELYVVAWDDGIRNACQEISNILSFSSLDEFISSDTCRTILQEESANVNIERLYKYLPTIISIRREDIELLLIDALEGTNVSSELIPNSTHVATIKSIEELRQDIEIEDYTNAQYYGEGLIIIPFHAQMETTVEFDLLISDYYNLSVKRTGRISVSKINDLFYRAEETHILNVSGNISLKVDAEKITEPYLSDQEIRSLTDTATIDIDSISQTKFINWDVFENQWEQHFLDLIRFKQETGHCEVPRKYPYLGHWVNNQRQRYQQGKLSRERIKRLDAIDFTWKIRPRGMLEEYIEQLLDYEQIYGHLNVSQNDIKYRKLGRWINDQRTKKTRGTLPKEYEDRLNEIEIVWNVLDAKWNQRLGELKEFHKKYGHFNISRDKEYPELYNWATKLRRRKPTEERLKKLNAIGYDWNEESQEIEKSDWNEKLEKLRAFHITNGHFDIPYEENRSLYNWVYKLKKRRPSDDRIKSLQSIGYDWEEESKKFRKSKWDDNFNQLKELHKISGHFNVSFKENPRLYKWIYKLKHKMPSDYHLKKLEAIGFHWEDEAKRPDQE